ASWGLVLGQYHQFSCASDCYDLRVRRFGDLRLRRLGFSEGGQESFIGGQTYFLYRSRPLSSALKAASALIRSLSMRAARLTLPPVSAIALCACSVKISSARAR